MPKTEMFPITPGERFGHLTALSLSHREEPYRRIWDFRCDCGTEKKIEVQNVRRGKTISCGCARKTFSARTKTIHGACTGGRPNPEYLTWQRMRERCEKPGSPDYHNYGQRGITVCARWASFTNFLEDMGERPSRGHSIGRREFNGNYEPANCFWSTWTEQARSRRNTRMVEIDGVWVPLQQEVERLGLPSGTLAYRHRHNMKSLAQVLNEKLPTL